MDILIDTHILVYREVDRTIQRRLQEVLRIISELNYRLVVHPLSVIEVEKDKNIPNKSVLLSKIRTYPAVNAPENPADDDAFLKLAGKPKNEREKVDSFLLYLLYKNGVDFFLTEDMEILEKAGRLDISQRVMNLKKASGFFKSALKKKKSEDGNAPVFCFYKKGLKWHIGEKGKESIFDDLKGFEFIHFLLSREDQYLEPRTVYHGGKSMVNESAEKILSEEENEEHHGLRRDSAVYDKRLSARERGEIIKRLHDLREALDSMQGGNDPGDSSSPESAMIDRVEEEIKKLEQRLKQKPARDYSSEEEKARINVTRAIRKALEIINKDTSISPILSYLNKSTIVTGDSCCYKPVLNNKPAWILDSESKNQ